jgi:hypothetical protein
MGAVCALRVKRAGTNFFNIQGKFGDVKREKGSGFKVRGSGLRI